jgi:hypothetical protein
MYSLRFEKKHGNGFYSFSTLARESEAVHVPVSSNFV